MVSFVKCIRGLALGACELLIDALFIVFNSTSDFYGGCQASGDVYVWSIASTGVSIDGIWRVRVTPPRSSCIESDGTEYN